MNLICPICSVEDNAKLSPIDQNHPEYQYTLKTDDSTKKWFICSKCGSTLCRDKIKSKWLMSAITYSKLLEEGVVEDRLDD